MRNITILIIALFGTFNILAQTYCGSARYQTEVFSTITKTADLQYGSNVDYLKQPINLFLDVYEPSGDTASMRPLMIMAHGGSFIDGVKHDSDVVRFCETYAKMGYVTVAIQYRLGWEAYNEMGGKRAVWRAYQDAKAAIRYLKSQANTYKIDTSNITFAGTSAGAFLGIHMKYLNKPSEIPADIDTTEYDPILNPLGLDGIRGKTNSLYQFSDDFYAIINLCGAIADTNWMEPSDVVTPLMSMHGTADATVPYDTRSISVQGVPIIPVSGSLDIHRRARNLDYNEHFFTYCGGPHVPYNEEDYEGNDWVDYFDTTQQFITQFLYEEVLGCPLVQNNHFRVNYKDSAECATITGIEDVVNEKNILLYPNPARNYIRVVLPENISAEINIYNSMGALVLSENAIAYTKLNIQHLSKGIYVVHIHSSLGEFQQKMIVE